MGERFYFPKFKFAITAYGIKIKCLPKKVQFPKVQIWKPPSVSHSGNQTTNVDAHGKHFDNPVANTWQVYAVA